jgi:long-chain fatty acid transport protein
MQVNPRLRAGVGHMAGIALTISTASLLSSAPALAAGFALLEQSASRLGTAFSGTAAAADDATTIYYNPAGMARLTQSEALLALSGIDIGSEFRNRNSQAALGQPLGGSGGDAGGWNAVPSAYLAVPASKDLVFGFALNAPFGLKLEYEPGWMGRFQALNSEIKTYNLNPAVSWRVNDWLSIGAGVNYQRLQAELTNSVNYTAAIGQGLQQLVAAGSLSPAAVPTLLAANTGLEGHARVRGDDSAWGYNVGVLFSLSADTRLGLAYRSSIEYDLRGSARFTVPAITNLTGAAIVTAASVPGGALAPGPVRVALEVPDSATASLSHRIGSIELLADVAWTGWSSVQELRVVRDSGTTLSVTPEEWRDTWRYALGATYKMSDSWKLRGGVAYDETPVPDATRTARLPDADRKWLAAGAQWMPADGTLIDFGYAHLFSNDVSMNQDDGNASVYGLLNGQQQSSVDIVSLQIARRF